MTDRELDRRAAHRLAVIRRAQEVLMRDCARRPGSRCDRPSSAAQLELLEESAQGSSRRGRRSRRATSRSSWIWGCNPWSTSIASSELQGWGW